VSAAADSTREKLTAILPMIEGYPMQSSDAVTREEKLPKFYRTTREGHCDCNHESSDQEEAPPHGQDECPQWASVGVTRAEDPGCRGDDRNYKRADEQADRE